MNGIHAPAGTNLKFKKRDRLAAELSALASRHVYLGASSWKYPGWRGSVYDEQVYLWRGRFAMKRFEELCLKEYAQVFKTVCVDAAYYAFPQRKYLEGLISQVPTEFLFAFKVTDEITVKRFPSLPRFGPRGGTANENFLNAELFTEAFLEPCRDFKTSIGILIFEFSKFYQADFTRGRDFVAALDEFLSRLPTGWPYGIEIRNRSFLQPSYFKMLARRGVVHVYNSWGEMPPVSEQAAIAASVTHPGLMAARFLLKPGRKYEEAVKLFSPYTEVKEPCPSEREAGSRLVRDGLKHPGRRTFIYVNNRLEGHAPGTISAMIKGALSEEVTPARL